MPDMKRHGVTQRNNSFMKLIDPWQAAYGILRLQC
jgi:hypothetical protein